jgi:D-aminoacyl-tRNA deacylase
LRVFNDEAGKMNLSLEQVQGAVLAVSQFTLYADTRDGNRPGFSQAAAPDDGNRLYKTFCEFLCNENLEVQTGIFQTEMKVSLVNDGPVTIIIDSSERLKP